MTKPNNKELKVLRGLCLGNIESPHHFGGIGPKTYTNMLVQGWIEDAYDETYDVEGYRITESGKAVFELYG